MGSDIEDTEFATAIVDAVRKEIDMRTDGMILNSGEAYVVALGAAKKYLGESQSTGGGSDRSVERALRCVYDDVRRMIAAQLIGMTRETVVGTVRAAVARFGHPSELETVPRPTKAFSGYCDPEDAWNLLSNALRVDRAVVEAEKTGLEAADIALKADLAKAVQMLRFLSQREVLVEDIEGKPYDGYIRIVSFPGRTRT